MGLVVGGFLSVYGFFWVLVWLGVLGIFVFFSCNLYYFDFLKNFDG